MLSVGVLEYTPYCAPLRSVGRAATRPPRSAINRGVIRGGEVRNCKHRLYINLGPEPVIWFRGPTHRVSRPLIMDSEIYQAAIHID